MIRSMTGFGSAAGQIEGSRYLVEVRSVNNKFFKAQVRLPDDLQGLESNIESAVSARLNRGSVVVAVRCTDSSVDSAPRLNVELLEHYVAQLRAVPGVDVVDASALLELPGVLQPPSPEDLIARCGDGLVDLVNQACDQLMQMREREGQTLHDDLHAHRDRIGSHLGVIRERAPEVVVLYQDRLRQRMESLLAEVGQRVQEEDLLREVAVFADRVDIAEEISRLEGHLVQFGEIIDAEHGEPVGRTLDFLSQEMLREANTIASKCLDVEVSRRIVEIKSAIDRIKEQAQNVE